MAKIKIHLNGTDYNIDKSALANIMNNLKTHFSTTMSGTGAAIELDGETFNIDSTKLSTATSNFISHLGTIAGSGEKVTIGGVEYGIDSTKVAGALGELETVLDALKTTVKTFKLGDTVEENGLLYTYIGVSTLQEAREAYKPQLEKMSGKTWDEIVTQFGGGDEEAVWQMFKMTEETFVPVEPSWEVKAANTDIGGNCEIKGEFEEIPVTNIGTFSGCTGLTSIIIPDSVTSIGSSAFSGCTGLTSITLSNSITEIALSTFEDCNNLTDIIIPANVTIIGDYAFKNCQKFTDITVPNNVVKIGQGAFSGCSSLESITLPFVGRDTDVTLDSKNSMFGFIFGTSSYDGGMATKQPYSNSWATFYIPESLKFVTITGGNILAHVFYNCGFTSVTIPDGVTSIGDYAFYKCSSLVSVVIPSSVTALGKYAFGECKNISNISFNGTVEQWNAITEIPNYAWDSNVNGYTIYCTDGTINKMGEVTYYSSET